ncbi:hypothetical protein AB2N08_00345 [Massilia aurea]|uniref:hypothetical protein n=1 Tax=Massilia aurea TaxID=373040 RepID=UPI0034623E0A
MAHITLVLPFALPLPEFAPDLVRAMNTPALSSLLSRTSHVTRARVAESTHALPHETWLARALGLGAEGRLDVAVAAMRGFGLDPEGGTWYIVSPGHIQIARTHLTMADTRQVPLSDDDSRALFAAAADLCEDIGHALRYGDAHTWFLRADDWTGFETASPDTVVNMDLTDFMPKGQPALAYRRLQNEVQMAWHAHPVNAARETRRLPVVNAFWVWGAGSTAPAPGQPLASVAVPGWLGALGEQRPGSLDRLDGLLATDRTLVVGTLAESAQASDWGVWLQEMAQLETTLFAPLLAAVKAGRVGKLHLVLSSREGLLEATTSAMAQRKFWRSPSLDLLK